MGLTRRLLAPLLAGLSLLTACSPADLLNATVPSDGIIVMHDVAFGPGPRRTLDVYRPQTPGGPLIVFLYGGSWRMGDKAMYPFVARPLAARGAVVVVPDYRVYPEVQFPAFVDDNAAAVAWAIKHAEALGGDVRSIFVVGHSAGAFNAAMLALDPHYLADAGVGREFLAGVVGLAGPYDFLPITGKDIKPVFASVDDGPASQPISYVDGRNPPLLLMTGDADTIVEPRNTLSLAARVHDRGGPVESKIYPGIGHVDIVAAFAPLLARKAPVLDDVWAFVQRHRP